MRPTSGVVLFQSQDEKSTHQIRYWSRTLNKAEIVYDTTHRECLAVIWEVLIILPYLEGAKFTIRRDHDSLLWTLTMSDATGKLPRWRLHLSEIEYDVVHRARIKNQAADALLRFEMTDPDDRELEDKIQTLLAENRKSEPHEMYFECDFTSKRTALCRFNHPCFSPEKYAGDIDQGVGGGAVNR